MIRILHMIGSLESGGSQSMVMNIYRKINRKKIQFDFIIDHADIPARMYYANEIRSLGGKIYTMPMFKGTNIIDVVRKWDKFFKTHPEYKVIHSHVRSYASIYFPIAKKYNLTTIIHSHSTSNGKGVVAVFKMLLQLPLRYQADYLFACSEEAGRWLYGKNIISNPNFHIIKNSIDTSTFVYNEDKRIKIRKELKINDDEFVVGSLGRVIEPKNPLFIVDFFYAFQKKITRSKLLFVGDGEMLIEVKKRASQYNITNKIIFTGTRSDTDKLYCAMDYYVFPSLWEGLGMSLIEAQASGLDCMCSENIPDAAIVTELVRREKLMIGAQRWADILANKIGNITKNRAEYANKIKESGYDISDNVHKLEQFYMKISV